ncbi:hexokinase [Pancytospora epiphaga]|nr:hexokinase [Pancytospora epiphaga]
MLSYENIVFLSLLHLLFCSETRNIKSSILQNSSTVPMTEDQNKTSKAEYFPVSFNQQRNIFERYVERINEVKNGKKDIFFSSGVDLEMLKKCDKEEVPHKIVVIDVGGTVFKATVMDIFSDNKKLKCKIGKKTEILYENWNRESETPLVKYRWHEWVAEVILRELEHETKDIRYAALTFSYSLTKYSINSAVINEVCKNWPFSKHNELTEEDLVVALNASLKKAGLSFSVNSVLNDSVSTCVHGITEDHPFETNIALILGTGTNISFVLSVNGKMELLNNEMARFPVPEDLLTAADRDVIAELEEKKIPYQKLEVLVAGYKFIDIIKSQLVKQGYSKEYVEAKVSLVSILSIINDTTGINYNDRFKLTVNNIARAYKQRAGRILAAILLAASISMNIGEDRTVRIIMNGSICQNTLDREIIYNELISFTKEMGYTFIFQVFNAPNASLDGSALSAVVHRVNL